MPDDTLKVATFNANSIRSRLALILDWLRREAPDVLCVQETKVQDPDFPVTAFTEAGWHVAFRGQKAHAGVAIISREEPAEVASGFDAGTSTSSAPGEPDHPRLLRAVIRGGIYLSEDVKDKMLFGAAAGRDPMASPLEVLSDRELEVFEMTGRGVETKEVAERLHLSVKTVESYRARIKTKLGLTNSTELIAHAVRWVEDNRAD